MIYAYEDVFKGKKSVLFVTAHPDDSLVYFAALIGRLRREKMDVYVLVVTNGARGSRENEISEKELASQRMVEEINALNKLDVERNRIFCLNYSDGEVESNYKLVGEISKYIREYKVDVVCTHDPAIQYQQTYSKAGYFVQHRDHRKVGEAVVDAIYPFSRDKSFFPEHGREGIEPHTVYDLVLTDESGANFDLDYTEYVEEKKAAMREHKSQFDENAIMEIIDAVKFNNRYLEKFKYIKLLW